MLGRERRRQPRTTPDPLRRERDALIDAVRHSEQQGQGPTVEALRRYIVAARAHGLDMRAVVDEFRSVYDRTLPGAHADVRHALRRERLVTQLTGMFVHSG